MLSRTIVSAIPRSSASASASKVSPTAATLLLLRHASSTAPSALLGHPPRTGTKTLPRTCVNKNNKNSAARALPVSISIRRGLSTSTSTSGSGSGAENDRSWVDKGEVTYAELKPETQAPSGNITIIDVREPDEVAQGIIPSAVSVPLSEFTSAFSPANGRDFVKKFGFERPEFGGKVVFYCRSGKRSAQALEFARSQGWWNSRNYTGSWLDWTANEEKK
ncbi:unnamed protein product [Tilletia controversa]|uniref:Rhodanese domain-containing protein n=1 Tax=Tilletia controversa TaxID=13291 RepID=A0A8X7MQJ8_9BASI|nr:hypothetical protein CF328_g5490 [Tilletia controversa]KAE8245823.1 hypothetical protein A4X06_0g5394 [Tilletia controversa]CAD6924414.1 unnamed protein product [Tilletia controversa]CAD6966922.1 unnamed protein product [Tilletia controversa]